MGSERASTASQSMPPKKGCALGSVTEVSVKKRLGLDLRFCQGVAVGIVYIP